MTPSHPVVSLLLGLSRYTMSFSRSFITPPLSVLVFGFQTVKSKPGQAVSPGMKDGEGREEGMGIEVGKDQGVKMWRVLVRFHRTGDGWLFLNIVSSIKISMMSGGFQHPK